MSDEFVIVDGIQNRHAYFASVQDHFMYFRLR